MTFPGHHRRRPCHLHGNRLYFAPGWKEKLAAIGLCDGCRWDRNETGEAITLGRRTRTRRITLSCGETIYFKRYLLFGKPFRFFLRPGQAAVEIYSYQVMAGLGLPIAEPVAVGEIRRWGSLFAGCVVTREVPDTITLKEYALQIWPALPEPARRQAFNTISTTIRRHLQIMHRHRFFHFDPKWRNILVRCDSNGMITGLWWIDAPRGRRLPGWYAEYGKARDLAALCRMALFILSRSQRLRFLRDYCGTGTGTAERKKLARRIDRLLRAHGAFNKSGFPSPAASVPPDPQIADCRPGGEKSLQSIKHPEPSDTPPRR